MFPFYCYYQGFGVVAPLGSRLDRQLHSRDYQDTRCHGLAGLTPWRSTEFFGGLCSLGTQRVFESSKTPHHAYNKPVLAGLDSDVCEGERGVSLRLQ